MMAAMSLLRRALLCLFFCAVLLSAPGKAQAFQSYFASKEIRADSIDQFPKWMDVLSRYKATAHQLDSICGEETYSPCRLKSWKDFLISEKDQPLDEQIAAINKFVNAYPYVEDIVNWGVADYWETPYEFQERNGDCEDFAIAKFMSLRALGLSNDLMRVMIVRDLNLGGIIHAILLVNVDDKRMILDNQIKQVMPAMQIYHYVPVYAINEEHWWQYFMPQ